jgi:hypothetical protein
MVNKPLVMKNTKLGFLHLPFHLIPTVALRNGHYYLLLYRVSSNVTKLRIKGTVYPKLPSW